MTDSMTPEDTPRMAERTDRQAQIDPWERLTSFRMRHGNGMLVDAYPKVSADAAVAALLRERDAQIASLTAQVEQRERQKHDANCELRGTDSKKNSTTFNCSIEMLDEGGPKGLPDRSWRCYVNNCESRS